MILLGKIKASMLLKSLQERLVVLLRKTKEGTRSMLLKSLQDKGN